MLQEIKGDRAESLAKRFCPTIYQEFASSKDFITGIMLDTEEQLVKNLVWAVNDPYLYYKISEDEEYFYAFYMVFHPFDWSSSRIGIIRNLDSHTFDTECFCVRWNKIHGGADLATIYHYEVRTATAAPLILWIEKEGHGIRPFEVSYVTESKKYCLYKPESFQLVEFERISKNQKERLKRILNSHGVNMPKQQAKKGKLFNKPDELFKELL